MEYNYEITVFVSYSLATINGIVLFNIFLNLHLAV